MADKNSDIAFTPAVKAQQEKHGSRDAYERLTDQRDWPDRLDANVAAFILERDSFYLATASADGQPYMQHRGGEPGFLQVLDGKRLAFADYRGNRQYISIGNLSENPKVMLFLMDYPNRQRVKVWGTAEVVSAPGPELLKALTASEGQPIERVIVIHIEAWDVNCKKWITPRYTEDQWRKRQD